MKYTSLEQEKGDFTVSSIKSPPETMLSPPSFEREAYSLLDPQDDSSVARARKRARALREASAFFLLGLINNTGYVIMLAAAKDIESGGVGLVFLSNVVPSFVVKLTGPYWFHLAPYRTRVVACSILMTASFIAVGCGGSVGVQLLGVCMTSLQSGLGEASLLALAALYDARAALTAWASDTGAAGIAGFAWVYTLHYQLGVDLRGTLLLALILPLLWNLCFFGLLTEPRRDQSTDETPIIAQVADQSTIGIVPSDRHARTAARRHLHQHQNGNSVSASATFSSGNASANCSVQAIDSGGFAVAGGSSGANRRDGKCSPPPPERNGAAAPHLELEVPAMATPVENWTFRERGRFVWSLSRYMVPLFVVYAAEYTMQSGAWSAIGFPVSSEEARIEFYELANWSYQFGVFASRSSGLLCQAGHRALWVMPLLQCALLVFFWADAVTHVWYNQGLLALCLLAGLLGGAVYVNAFTLIAREVHPAHKEFALGAASLGDSLGIIFSSFAGVFLQACLYKANGIDGAVGWC